MATILDDSEQYLRAREAEAMCDGNTAIWLLNGLQISQSGGLGQIPTTWSVVGTADFNADGKGDLLWLDNTGNVAIWLMNGLSILQAGGLGNVNTWTVAGTADFNGDSRADILWYNGGIVAIWLMNGLQVSQSGGLGFVSTQWSIVGTGDFNGRRCLSMPRNGRMADSEALLPDRRV